MILGWFMNRNRNFFCGRATHHVIGLFCFFCFTSGQAYADDVCSNEPDDVTVARCLGDQVQASSAELEKYYQEALTKLPEVDNYDYEKARGQLVKGQTAWKVYVSEQCKLVGALQGGSSLFISIFESQCLWDENGKRIEFIKKLPDVE